MDYAKLAKQYNLSFNDDLLIAIYQHQKVLYDIVLLRNSTDGGFSGQIIAAIVELNEYFTIYNNATMAYVDPKDELEEFIDILFFLVQALIVADIQIHDIFLSARKSLYKILNSNEIINSSFNLMHYSKFAQPMELWRLLANLLNVDGGFKWWKQNHDRNKKYILELLGEIFVQYFLLAFERGYDAGPLWDAYKNKWVKNIERQKNNY